MSLTKKASEFIKHSGMVNTPGFVRWGLRRISEEVDEAYSTDDELQIVGELIDIILTSATLVSQLGYDVDKLLDAKHAINLERQWGPHPSIPGAVQHIPK